MQYLLSLPTGIRDGFHKLEKKSSDRWFAYSDPEKQALGSGGGAVNLLAQCWKERNHAGSFSSWLESEKRILINGGGKSRRVPAYATSGKIFTPIPVFRWERGQDIDQKLIDLQLPFYERILRDAPAGLNTLIASGDILILNKDIFTSPPQVDVLLFSTWAEASQASNHGVFFCPRDNPGQLAFMLQKPSLEKIQELVDNYYFLLDTGLWLLSPRAVDILMRSCGWDSRRQEFSNRDNIPSYYDLYGSFSQYLGCQSEPPPGLKEKLSTAVIPLPPESFYHFGTSRELIDSTYRIQNLISDQREIWHKRIKRHPDIFIMNSLHAGLFDSRHHNLWMENSTVPGTWNFSHGHIFTGIPDNQWRLHIPNDICLDAVPIGEDQWCFRPYGIDDKFQGLAGDSKTGWLNQSLVQWFETRRVTFAEADIDIDEDIYEIPLFPVVRLNENTGDLIQWMVGGSGDENDRKSDRLKSTWLSAERLSAARLQNRANLERLYSQRRSLLYKTLPVLAENHRKSVFYQIDLDKVAELYLESGLSEPVEINRNAPLMDRIHSLMLTARLRRKKNQSWNQPEEEAFRLLREGLIEHSKILADSPSRNVLADQIVWARSPVRMDLAGGWSDTPPYCISQGGRVVNMAVELNGQCPIQVYITPNQAFNIRIKSIDLGQELTINEYTDLEDYNQVGSGFAIAKAALILSGFHPDFGASFTSLKKQLRNFTGGFDISLLAAVPKGSGLGTSSILAATLVGALSDYCGLNSDHIVLGKKTLVLEQMLTTGGGWQDQYGGILAGAKLIATSAGFEQTPEIHWLPEWLFRNEEYRSCMLLYYTGVTRVAKNILGEIVRRMFLNHGKTLALTGEIKSNADRIAEAVRKGHWQEFAHCLELSWKLNQQLDEGTNPDIIQRLIEPVEHWLAAKKLLGAGGGGYLFMLGRDPEAAGKVKAHLINNPPNLKARFVDFKLSSDGLSITRS